MPVKSTCSLSAKKKTNAEMWPEKGVPPKGVESRAARDEMPCLLSTARFPKKHF